MKPKITIIGAGESGVGAALLAHVKGHEIFVSSKDKIEKKYKTDLLNQAIPFEEGQHTIDKIVAAQLIIKSPGVPNDIEPLQVARSKQIEIIDETEFAFTYLKGKVIAISGTNGKTTVTRLIYHLMKENGLHVALAGNVGNSLARQVLEDDYDWYVVEMSSFQLEGIKTWRANISVLLNITPDHLDRYEYNFENYVNTKLRLVQQATEDDYFIYYKDDPSVMQAVATRDIKARKLKISLTSSEQTAAFFDSEQMRFPMASPAFVLSQQSTALRGPHNSVNIMASVLSAHLAGVNPDGIEKALATFSNAPHRLEWIANIEGVEFINDSKATNVDATMHALESYTTPLIWIAGGVDKGNNYDQIRQQVQKKVKMLLCLGRRNEKLKKYFSSIVPLLRETCDIKELVKIALREAAKGDVVLLSPACASFDLFANYEDRGNQFRKAVLMLKKEIQNPAKR